MKVPLFLYAALFFAGRNRNNGTDNMVLAALGCLLGDNNNNNNKNNKNNKNNNNNNNNNNMGGEMDGILSLLQHEQQDSNKAKTYVITGATSGIGLDAAKILAMMNPENRLFIVGRNERTARTAAKEIASVLPRPRRVYRENIIPIACDHSSFDSVRKFAVELRRKLDESYDEKKWERNGVDVLCLNAAILQPNDLPAQFTKDGLEITFQTNHLSPFLLVNLVHQMINPGGRVVVSTSGLYLYQKLVLDGMYDKTTGHPRKQFETADGSDYNCKKSYAFSKLCNVAMAVELHERLQPHDIAIISFSPGLITRTGLFRYHRMNHPMTKFPQTLMANEKTVAWGAGALVYMATSHNVGQSSGTYWHDPDSDRGPCAIYGKDFAPYKISESHISVEKRQELWTLSSQLTEISSTMIPQLATASSTNY